MGVYGGPGVGGEGCISEDAGRGGEERGGGKEGLVV